jgi:TolA-binding protein
MTDLRASGVRDQQSQQAREQMRVQAEQIRKQAEEMREHAQEMREQAQEAAREAQRAAEEAIREAQAEGRPEVRVIRVPPLPPPPPGQETHTAVPPWQQDTNLPGEMVDIVGMLTFATAAVLILRPLMRAFANRFERRGAPPPALPAEVSAHMQRLEQAIEAVAIEVERISEGQRYTTKLLAERAGKEKVG